MIARPFLKWAGGRALLSNADCAVTRDLYEGLHIEGVSAPRSINRDGAGRGKVGELLVSTMKPGSPEWRS